MLLDRRRKRPLLKQNKGQAMVEFALVLPVLVLILCGIIDFGWLYGNQLAADNASREAARYTSIHYYEYSSRSAAQTAATQVVSQRAKTLTGTTVTVSVTGDQLTVKVRYQIRVLTPVVSTFTGPYWNGQATSIMRIE